MIQNIFSDRHRIHLACCPVIFAVTMVMSCTAALGRPDTNQAVGFKYSVRDSAMIVYTDSIARSLSGDNGGAKVVAVLNLQTYLAPITFCWMRRGRVVQRTIVFSYHHAFADKKVVLDRRSQARGATKERASIVREYLVNGFNWFDSFRTTCVPTYMDDGPYPYLYFVAVRGEEMLESIYYSLECVTHTAKTLGLIQGILNIQDRTMGWR